MNLISRGRTDLEPIRNKYITDDGGGISIRHVIINVFTLNNEGKHLAINSQNNGVIFRPKKEQGEIIKYAKQHAGIQDKMIRYLSPAVVIDEPVRKKRSCHLEVRKDDTTYKREVKIIPPKQLTSTIKQQALTYII